MQETIHTIDGCMLNKTEIDVLCIMHGATQPQCRWSLPHLSRVSGYDINATATACDMLILHGVIDALDADGGRTVAVTDGGYDWCADNKEDIYSLHLMLDCEAYDQSETAEA